MSLHSYIKYLWKNAPDHKTTPINADNLNHMETGIADAHTDIAAVQSEAESLVAPIETSSTASQAYSIGDQFIYNGLLYKATAAISSGGTITPNGNCTVADSVVNQINNLIKTASYTATSHATYGTIYTNIDATSVNILGAYTTDYGVEVVTDSNNKYVFILIEVTSSGLIPGKNKNVNIRYTYI